MRYPWIGASLGAALTTVALSAQTSMVESYNQRFAKSKPVVGDPLPDAAGFTADGEPFELGSTRGKLTVIVSGCLT